MLENYILSDNEALLSSWRTSLFIWLSSLVGEISKYSHLNKMSPTNMAIVISPNLFNPDILQNRGLSELGQRLFVEMIIYQLRQDIGPDLLGFSYDTPLDVPPPVPPLETAIMALVADAKETKSTAEDVLTENTKDSLSSEDEPKATARDEANVIKEGKLRSKTLMDITKVSCSEEESGTRRTAEAQLRAVSMASEPVLKRKSDQDRMGK